MSAFVVFPLVENINLLEKYTRLDNVEDDRLYELCGVRHINRLEKVAKLMQSDSYVRSTRAEVANPPVAFSGSRHDKYYNEIQMAIPDCEKHSECNSCHKYINQSADLADNMTTHTGELPYSGTKCNNYSVYRTRRFS